ncbi:hypothetical protein FWK35_00032913 [Aphis craccivora]|uniref:Uncharacterized protein n=1 Tax=Aphis craccivora TaxID=307492 RepID=A0A6G0Z837_APHCR|nr:hypothetical protein FWK35_00032913 [Aphis craccivora]
MKYMIFFFFVSVSNFGDSKNTSIIKNGVVSDIKLNLVFTLGTRKLKKKNS